MVPEELHRRQSKFCQQVTQMLAVGALAIEPPFMVHVLHQINIKGHRCGKQSATPVQMLNLYLAEWCERYDEVATEVPERLWRSHFGMSIPPMQPQNASKVIPRPFSRQLPRYLDIARHVRAWHPSRTLMVKLPAHKYANRAVAFGRWWLLH